MTVLKKMETKCLSERELKFLGYIMRTKEPGKHDTHRTDWKHRRKPHISYLVSLSKWMAKQGSGEEKKNLLSYKGQEIMESHDCQHSKGTQHIEEFEEKKRILENKKKFWMTEGINKMDVIEKKKIKQGKSYGWINILEDGDKKHF